MRPSVSGIANRIKCRRFVVVVINAENMNGTKNTLRKDATEFESLAVINCDHKKLNARLAADLADDVTVDDDDDASL